MVFQKGNYSIDETLSENVRQLISRMLCVDATRRIRMAELCAHPWFLEDGEPPIEIVADPKGVRL